MLDAEELKAVWKMGQSLLDAHERACVQMDVYDATDNDPVAIYEAFEHPATGEILYRVAH